jgi:hypothetical protein
MSGNTTTPVAMSGYITPAYTFTPGPSGVGTINLSGINDFNIKRLVAIINQTAGEIIYSSANSSYNYTNVVGTTITLKADTTGQNSTDILQVVYDTGYVVLDPTFPINIDSVYVSNEVEVTNDIGNPLPVFGPLTDAQLRATPVPVSISSSIELEVKNDAGNPLPISGTVSANQAGTWNINDVSGTISLPTGAATAAKQDTQSTQLTQIESAIDALSLNVVSPQDILGVGISGARYNQVEINFEVAPGAGLITETFTGGGFVTITSGHSIYATGAAATASTKVVTTQKVIYRPAHEIYSYFTAAFTTGVANTFQRIGIFDDNNGFYIGYENNLFGITKRTSGVNTFVARSLWNGDALNGGSTSNFTRNGIPEAINLNYSNLFRIRFAWLGSASVIFEVFSPDGLWIPFHTLKIPNSQYDPSITNPDLPLSLHISKNAANGTNIAVATACWAGGTTSDYVKISDTLTNNTLASLTRSVITGQTTAGGGGFVNVKVNPSGALTVAATQDSPWNVSVLDSWKSTYTASVTNYIPYANATDVVCISGSATKTIRIYRVHISGTANPANTTNTNYDIFLIKRSTLNTGDTPTAVAPIPHDSANPAATATVTRYSSLPVLGTAAGTVRQESLFVSTGSKGGDNPVQPGSFVDMEFATHPNLQPIVLRGVNESLCLNFNGISILANLEIDIMWTEE